jgi:chitodextrinase
MAQFISHPFRTLAGTSAALLIALFASPSPAHGATDRTPPTVPQALRVTDATDSSVSIAWTASTDRSGGVTYRVYVNGVQVGSPSGTSYTVTGLDSASNFALVVRAQDRYGNISAPSTALSASTTTPTVPPPSGGTGSPHNLRVTANGYDNISLAWDPAAGTVMYYQVFRNGQWVDTSYGTAITLRNLSAGATYAIEVRARDGQNNLSAPASISAATRVDEGAPTTPANLRVVTSSTGAPVGLAWDSSTDDRGVGLYWLFADGDTVFAGGPGVSFLALTDELCTVFRGETYTFSVRAQDLSGTLSAPSTAVTVTVR